MPGPRLIHDRPITALLASLVVAALVALPADASGPSRDPFLSAPADSFETTTTAQFDVLEVDAATRTVRLRDRETRRELAVQLHEGVPLRAGKKAHFGGRKRLAFEDLAVGQRLVITSVRNTGEIKKIRVRVS